MAGAIETQFGLVPNTDLAAADLYFRRVEAWAWDNMIPQENEIDAHYYFDFTTDTGTETGAGTEGDPYVAFKTVNVVLGTHASTDVIKIHARTNPSIGAYLYLGTTNKVEFDADTPEVLWVPWKGQCRFSSATTAYTTGWTLVGGTCYKRTVTKPGWVSNYLTGFIYPQHFKWVDTQAECEAEEYTWHHDGTDLFVNSGGDPQFNSTGVRTCPDSKTYLISTQSNCRRVLLSGLHFEGFGVSHGNSGGDPDAGGIKLQHGYRNDRVLISNVTDLAGGGHAISVTGPWEGGTGYEATTVFVDCTSGGGYEVNKGHSPFNFYAGGGSECVYIRCRNICGPLQGSNGTSPFAGHSNGGAKVGMWYLWNCQSLESTGQRPSCSDGQPGFTSADLIDTDPGQRAFVGRYHHDYRQGSGPLIPTVAYSLHTYLGCVVEKNWQYQANTNAGGAPTNHGTASGLVINGVYRFTANGSSYRVLGDGGSPTEKYINCLWLVSSHQVNCSVRFGHGSGTFTGLRFINCIFANVNHAALYFDVTDLTDVYQNCGFYRCTPPSNAVDPIIIDDIEPYIARYKSGLLGAGMDVSSTATVIYDHHGRRINPALPPLGPFGSIVQYAS
jgi:hypothetical protein